MKINKKIRVGCSFVGLIAVPIISEASIGKEIRQEIRKTNKNSKTANIVEITLNDGESLQDRISEIQGKTSVKIITTGSKVLDVNDFRALNNANIANIDLSEASATKIPESAFRQNTTLESIVFPRDLQSIDRWAFHSCSNLSGELILPPSLTSIGDTAFYNCTGITGTLVIPDSLTSVYQSSFFGCNGIETIVFGSTLREIEISSYYDPSFAPYTVKNIYMQVNPDILGEEYYYNTVSWMTSNPEIVTVELPFNFNPEGTWVNYESYNGDVKKSSIDIKNITSDGEVNINEGDTATKVVIRISDNTDFNALNLTLNGEKIELSEDCSIYPLTEVGTYEFSRTFKNGDIETITFNIDNPYAEFPEVGEAIERVKLTRNATDLAIARELVNKIEDSNPKKLEFQNILNSIEIDMAFEPKSATANVDIYIKSENMLKLSLDTNSITFEDFSGVTDMVKPNALELTVSSSLPYQVDAYLATEIQNADKNKNMNKEILKIKANVENEDKYASFTDVNTTPITLLDDQQANNDVKHGIDFKLVGGDAFEKDVYKATIKFEVKQK